MKFLVLALCVCAASAASVGGYKPWQPLQQGAQAVAKAVVYTPEVAVSAVQPVAKTFEQAAVKAYNTPVTAVKSAVYGDKEANAAILRSDSEVAADGYNFYYETQNGIAAQSTGVLRKVDNSEVLAIQGSYQYTAPDGTPVQFSYVADENGYQPKSDLLPVGPAIPEAILRSLEYIRSHPQKYVEKN